MNFRVFRPLVLQPVCGSNPNPRTVDLKVSEWGQISTFASLNIVTLVLYPAGRYSYRGFEMGSPGFVHPCMV